MTNPTHTPAAPLHRIGVASLLTAFALLLCFTGTSLAARGHVPGPSFGKEGSGPGELKEPDGLAVNETTGDIYVVDKGNDRVEWFSPTGKFEGEFNGSGEVEVGGVKVEGVAAGEGGQPNEIPTKRFEAPEGIAVDNACQLHKPEPLTEATSPTCSEYDPSSEDVYLLDTGNKVIDKYTPTGKYIGQITGTSNEHPFSENPFAALNGVATDPKGNLWIVEQQIGGGCAEPSNGCVANEFNDLKTNIFAKTTRTLIQGFQTPGAAVDAEDNIYATFTNGSFTPVVAKFSSSGGRLVEALDLEQSNDVAVEETTGDVFVNNVSTVARFDENVKQVERLAIPGSAPDGSGVAVDSSRETAYAADAASDRVDVFLPKPPGAPPAVAGSSVLDVASESATFDAEVDPEGEPASYRFEYGPCDTPTTCASSPYVDSTPTPEGVLAAKYELDPVSVHPQDLAPGTPYHFRLVAQNVFNGAVQRTLGEEIVLTTQTAGGEFVLPDGREWELVSPPLKHGATVESLRSEGVLQAAASGDAITYFANVPTEAEPTGNDNGTQVLSTRGASSWNSRDMLIPYESATGASITGHEYRFFSENLALGVAQPFGAFMPLSGEASEQTAYLQTVFTAGEVSDPCSDACFRPLVTGKPGFANVPEDTEFGEKENHGCLACGPKFVGATPDASHVVVSSLVGLTAGTSGGLYEWSAGKLAFVGGPYEGTQFRAISSDGVRVIYQTEAQGAKALFMHDMATDVTVRLDTPQGGSEAGPEKPEFQAAGPEASKVWFTDSQRLTEHSGAEANKPDLYECAIDRELKCALTDLTPETGGKSASVIGHVLGASEANDSVYFVADGMLSGSGAGTQGTCSNTENNVPGATCNLYKLHEGAPRLVATLSAEDSPDWATLADHAARVSPNGEWLAFVSNRDLAKSAADPLGYDNRDARSGRPDEELYIYHAGTDKLVCASCNPTGARPVGEEVNEAGAKQLFDGNGFLWPNGRWVAASVPGWDLYWTYGEALYQSRYLSDSGRLFFDSSDTLVSQDVNNTWDVYEFEPVGVGTCTSETSSGSSEYVPSENGCVGLTSAGTSPEESVFMDASESGGDVFFLTNSRLSGQDVDTAPDVYDAHECGVSTCFAAAMEAPPPCDTGDSCKAAPTPQPQIFGAPASATFAGVGNLASPPATKAVVKKASTRAQKLANALKQCHKDRKEVKMRRCEKAAKKAYGPLKPVKKSNRRAK